MSKNVTDRIWKMREALVATTPEIFANRARLVTESYRETLGMPYVLRRAKALDKVLRQMDICIAEGELVVGSYAGRPRGCQVYPEYDMAFVIDELDLFEKREADRFVVSEETKAELRALHGDWQGNTIADTALGIFPEEVRESAGDGVFLLTTLRCGIGHIIVDYPLLLREGVRGLKARIAAQRDALDFGDARYGEKLVYYQAADICCDAFVAFAHRFAALAEEQAAAESDATRQAELRLIAQNCRRVPEAPAQNFYEALQAFWLLHLVLHLESSGHSVSPGRFDQYMIPYYAQDLADGATTEAEAEERLHALWL
ncbi:MAG: pyruvate formate lyase family protein, partial [Oscillospiraceae bacterium]